MPEGEPVAKEEGELERKVRPHDLQTEVGIEVDHNGTGKHSPGWAASWVVPDDRRPANFLNESLLEGAPAVAHIPAKPGPVDACKRLAPFTRRFEDVCERNREVCPVAFAYL